MHVCSSGYGQHEQARSHIFAFCLVIINHMVAGQISYDDVIENFVARKVRFYMAAVH